MADETIFTDLNKFSCNTGFWRTIGFSVLCIIIISIISNILSFSDKTNEILFQINGFIWGINLLNHFVIQHWILNKKYCNKYELDNIEQEKQRLQSKLSM
jgi:hypothetical protein